MIFFKKKFQFFLLSTYTLIDDLKNKDFVRENIGELYV